MPDPQGRVPHLAGPLTCGAPPDVHASAGTSAGGAQQVAGALAVDAAVPPLVLQVVLLYDQ